MSLAIAIESVFNDETVLCPVTSVAVYCVHLYINSSTPIFIQQRDECMNRCSIRARLNGHRNGEKSIWNDCRLPAVSPIDKREPFSAGLCASVRRLVNIGVLIPVNSPLHPDGILGFRKSCLQAPSEASSWTKFCEIEATSIMEETLEAFFSNIRPLRVPQSIDRFEEILQQPPRVHNAGHVAKILGREITRDYAEGPYFTLADILLYPSIKLVLSIFDAQTLLKIKDRAPLVFDWIDRIESIAELKIVIDFIKEIINLTFSNVILLSIDNVDWLLWTNEPKDMSLKQNVRRTFIHDEDLELALSFITDGALLELNDSSELIQIDWLSLPSEVTPFGGCLPNNRAPRKLQQLENLASSVVNIAQPGHRIVDFCSGGGHLGILLAFLLPDCEIVLVENKERSLNMAQKRINTLKLRNVTLIQCNLDYFIGSFDIGVALHACGPATDLVLENCIEKKASFVVCPCCYGSVRETNRLKYPRSSPFSDVPINCYLRIGHSADQTHVDHPMEERGVKCMRIIDSDRAQHAISHGYSVVLSQLKPVSCTPKNMLIVGIYNSIF